MNRLTLSYAAPRVLYRSHYVFRTLNGTMAIVVALLISALLAAVAVYGPVRGRELPLVVVRAGFALVALTFGGIGLRALWGWIRNDRIRVEINEDGIVHGNRFWSWHRVHSFEGIRYTNGVALGFTARGVMVGLGAGTLPTTPLLSEQEYAELAREVSRCTAARFPHVDVAIEPRDPPPAG